ncbi:MAG: hypothetical protein IKH04_01645 [Kiritimatiellae bacterium]|nr:hypothetical protein [Kiritimatiellia bacterium]
MRPSFAFTAAIAATMFSAAAEVAMPPYGVCAHLIRHEHDFRDEESAWIAASGARAVRFAITWTRIQNAPGAPFDFAFADATVADAEAHGLTVLPILYGAPKWAWPVYEHLEEFGEYVEAVVSHYAGRIPAVEIWNEENIVSFWKEDPDPAKYAAVLRTAYEAAKRANPDVRVYIGGTAGVPLDYLRKVYEAGGGACFDAMNVHPYSHPFQPEGGLDRQLEDLRALMAQYGDAGKPIVITEHGWPTHDARVTGAAILRAGLKVARPEQAAWRVVYAATHAGPDGSPPSEIAYAIEEALPPGSSAEACFGARLRERLAAGDVDAVIYPFDSSFPEDTFDDVCAFVRDGGVLVDLGGAPLWWRCRETAPGRFERVAQDNGANPLREKLRVDVDAWWLNPALPQEGRAFPTEAAKAAGYKGDPAGERVWRFQTARLLKEGDEFIPLLEIANAQGRKGLAPSWEDAGPGKDDSNAQGRKGLAPSWEDAGQEKDDANAQGRKGLAPSWEDAGQEKDVAKEQGRKGLAPSWEDAGQGKGLAPSRADAGPNLPQPPSGVAGSAVAACVMRFNSDMKGAVVLSGDKTRGTAATNDEANQARYLARAMAIAFAEGVERYFWYEFRGLEEDPGYSEHHFGLTHSNMTPKPAFGAYRNFTLARPAGSVQSPGPWHDEARAFFFPQWTRPDGTPAGIVWKTGATERRELRFEPSRPVTFRDHTGRLLAPAPTANGGYIVPIGENPIYFEGAVLQTRQF